MKNIFQSGLEKYNIGGTMAKFLHCADLHLDTKFQYLDVEKNAIRREELRELFSRIVSIAISELVDVVFIAGDLFEGMNASANSLELIHDEIERAKPIRFFIAPGNHDPYTPNSQFALLNLPDNAYIFKSTQIEKIVVEELNLVVYGAAFVAITCSANLLADFHADADEGAGAGESGYASVAVIHGDMAQNSVYNYISKKDIENSGLDYLALGHIHSTSIEKIGKTTYAYPGAPEGRGFDECGDKGILIGEISKGKVSTEFRQTAYRRYFVEVVDVSDCQSHEEIVAKIGKLTFLGAELNFYKLVLKGEVDFEIDVQQLQLLIANDFYFVKVIDETTASVDVAGLSEGTLKSIFITKMDEQLQKATDDKEKKILSFAKYYGTAVLERRDIKI